ncbi:MAG TPA: hypothetical protein VGM87_22670 [Roseomonas sp.]|jgi:hypothetical protein
MNPLPKSLRDLGLAARQASDRQLMELVGMVDRLPARGAADAVLQPVRARLKHLRPERPLTLARLLFLPLDAVLVGAQDWRPGQRQIPRTAIAPLIPALRAAEPLAFQAAEAALAGRSLRDGQLISELGATLWAAGARGFPAQPPAGWGEAGLPATAFPPIAGICRQLWQHGSAIWTLRLAGGEGPPERALRLAFHTVVPDGPAVVGLVLSALLPHVTQPAQMAATVGGLHSSLSGIAEQVLDSYLVGIKPDLDRPDLAAVAEAAGRFVQVLEDLDRATSRDRPKRAQLLHSLRQAAADACAGRLAAHVDARLMQPLRRLVAAPRVSDTEVEQLESTAIALQSIVQSGRGLRPGGGFDQALAPAIALLEGILPSLPATPARYAAADGLRLLEILAGSAMAARNPR